MPIPIYTIENPIICATTAIRDALLKDPAYKVAGLSVQVGADLYFLNADLSTWRTVALQVAIDLLFSGVMQSTARAGFEFPFAEYTKADKSGQFYMPEITPVREFSLHLSGTSQSIVANWYDSRSIGLASSPAVGLGTLLAGVLHVSINYGGYIVTVDGAIVGNTLAATIQISVRGASETLSCLVTDAPITPVPPATYISQFGNDANDGLSLITSIRTFPAPQDGHVYYIERGSVFAGASDRLADESKEFTVADCGIGHQYVGNQCDVVTGWVPVDSGAYSAAITAHASVDNTTGYSQVIEDGFPLYLASSIADCKEKAGSYFFSNTIGNAPTVVTLYVHPTGSGDPQANGKVYEATVRELFLAGRGSCKFSGYLGRGSTTPSGSVVVRAHQTDGTDRAICQNFIVSHAVFHNQYQASGEQLEGLALFCQPTSSASNLSYWVFHRGGIDVVPVNVHQSNCAIIDSPYRAQGSNATGYDWHSDSTLGSITLDMPYQQGVWGCGFFPSGAAGVLTVNDPLFERMGNSPGLFTNGVFNVQRLRVYQQSVSSVVPGPRLLTGPASLNLSNFIALIPWGNNVGSTNTFDGWVNPSGGADLSSVGAASLSDGTVINVGSYSRKVFYYFGASDATHKTGSYAFNRVQMSGWTSDTIWGDIGSVAGSSLSRGPSDYNAFDVAGAATWVINNTVSMTFPQYQSGWYGTYPASDANSSDVLTTYSPASLSGRYPIPVQTTTNPGGHLGGFVDVQQYLGVLCTQAFEAAGRLPA